ncbi:MAG TPA: TolC family protein [Spirochaetia bacterium]|nr:TolC family protein [Spirochaetia bacterium]
MRRTTGVVVALFLGCALCASGDQLISLDQLVRAGLADNPDIEQLASARAYSQAGLAGARASGLPSVRFQSSYSYIPVPPAYDISQGSLGSFTIPPAGPTLQFPATDITVPQDLYNWNFNFGLQIDQPIFLWGKIRGNIALHRQMVLSDAVRMEKKQAEIRTAITVQLYSLYYLDQLHRLVGEQRQTAEQMFQIAQDSFTAGQINEADLTEKRMAFRMIDHSILAIEEQEQTALRSLRSETGLLELRLDTISFEGVNTSLDRADLPPQETLVAEALGGNRDLKLLAVAQEIQKDRVGIADSDALLKPDLSLSAVVTYGGPRLPLTASDWTAKDNFGGNISLVIGASLFDGGKAASSVAQAKAQLDQTAYQKRSTERDIRSYVEQTRYQLDVDRKNIEYFSTRVDDTQKLVAYQKHLLDIGAGSRLDYFQRRIDLYTQQVHVLEERLGFANRFLTLMNVVGRM